MTTILTIAAIVVFIAGIIFLLVRYGVQKYVSDYFYRLRADGKELYFTVWMGLVSTLTLYPLIMAASSIVAEIAAVMCCTFLHFVGAAPDYKAKGMLTWHNIGAFGAAGCAAIVAIAEGYMLETTMFQGFALLVSIFTKPKDYPHWAEVGAFVTIFYILIFN